MKLVKSFEGLAFPITLHQTSKTRFRVTYGKQVREGLDYVAAAKELGLCLFHAMACDGVLDNEE